MLETLVTVANFLKSTFYYVLYGSYKTGNLLVLSLYTLFQYFLTLTSNCLAFLTVLYESVVIFLQDNVQYLQQVVVIAQASFDAIYRTIGAIFQFGHTIIALIVSSYTAVFSGLTATFTAIVQIVVFLKKLVILFGLGVWFLITFLPLLLYYFSLSFVTLINACYKEVWGLCCSGASSVKTLVKSIILFVVDVPLESMAGILIAISLTYVFAQFSMLITSYLKQKLRKLRAWYRQQEPSMRNIIYRPRVNNRRPIQQARPNKSPEDNEQYCVICQERVKRVLLLPCRHLCLCTECSRELRYYNETCPICRTNIDSTMQVYV